MNLTEQQQNAIKLHIQEKEVIEKLFDYLSRHEIVGEEIFPYLGEKFSDLSDRYTYRPVSKDTFIRRLPFYCYKPDLNEGCIGNLSQYVNGIISKHMTGQSEHDFDNWLEKMYCTLETMLYDLNLDVKTIFEYPIEQTGYCSRTDILFEWAHYLELTKKFDIQKKTPEHLIVDYNLLLERANLLPIIYELTEQFIGEYISRSGNIFRMEGTFPCDRNGQPILRWIGVTIKNAKKIWAVVDKKLKGTLFVEATPKTAIWGLNCWGTNDDGTDAWYDLYIAPLLMEFDFIALKDIRKREKLTQQQVADAIGAAVRTYQKWESGDTTPDCHYLLRLMNVLDIREINELTKLIER
ncbi:helix-turn-helix transcriptional regulator [Desulfosporosinus sp. BG]|uniref:helix-turn-helix domain-containing protein n=1 Tax=Desulfosporosinus sp. BG TaxID=1633135 RepID=UPI00083B98FE|nr:helix-turn-helix transcriptional regulator [Desulfosporosinus sp. BG]ODA43049.1 hypothetical protein DSBG_0045 [Desulfosporosinus sp. BG]